MNQRSSWIQRLAIFRRRTPLGWTLRYGLAVAAVAAAFVLRAALVASVGAELSPYILFYPTVMAVALLAGFGPGVLATALATFTAGYWILRPGGQFSIDSPADCLGLAIFTAIGLFLSVVAELHRRDRSKAAAYDRELAVRDIRHENEFLANLLDHASQPFAVGYPDGRIGRLNRAYEQLTGYTAEELHALDWSTTLTPPEWREVEKQNLDELKRSGRPVRYEKEYLRKDGSRVPVALLVHLAKSAEGKPLYYYSFVTDVTEHKRAVEELAGSAAEILRQKELLAVTLASIGDGVIVTDAQGRVTFLNGEAERLTGWSSGQAEGNPLPDVFHIINEKTRQPAEDPVERVLRLGTTVGLANHTVLVAKDGREIPIDDSGAPICQAGGPVQGVVLVFRDATEQKQAERTLARLAAIVESSDDAILSTDLRGVIQTWNAGAARLFGYRAEEVVGQPTTLLLPPERMREEEEILARLLDGQRVEHLETERVAKDGRRIDVSVTVSPVKDQDGQIIGASKIVRDVTERKRAEEALRESEQRRAAAEAMKAERERFDTLLNMLPAYVILLSPDYRVPFANRFFEERFGKSQGRRCYEYLFDRSEPCDNCETFKVLDTGRPHHWEWTGPDGRDYDIHDFPFTDADGSQLIMEVGLDVTEMKKAQAAVQIERQRLFAVLETLPTMVCLLTLDHHVAFANRSFREKFGESDGRHCYEYRFGRAEPCDFCESYKALETGMPHQWEVNAPDGSVIEAHDFPFTDVDGSPLVLEMDIDVTEQRRAEVELKQYRHRLEQLVEQRTEQLTAATAEAQQLAAEATQAAQTIRHLSRFPEENPNPVLRIGRDGTILYANPASGPLLAQWGLAAGQSMPEDWIRRLAATIGGGEVVEQEVECGGRVFSCLLTPIAGETYVNIYGRDVTAESRPQNRCDRPRRSGNRPSTPSPTSSPSWTISTASSAPIAPWPNVSASRRNSASACDAIKPFTEPTSPRTSARTPRPAATAASTPPRCMNRVSADISW